MLCESTLDRLDQPAPVQPPALTDADHRLLHHWFDSGPDIRVIADRAGMTLHALALWSQQPHIVAATAAIRAMFEQRTSDLALASADAAINCLKVTTMIEEASAETKRKAAAQLFRAVIGARAAFHTRPAAFPKPPRRPASPPDSAAFSRTSPGPRSNTPLAGVLSAGAPASCITVGESHASPGLDHARGDDAPHAHVSRAGADLPPRLHLDADRRGPAQQRDVHGAPA